MNQLIVSIFIIKNYTQLYSIKIMFSTDASAMFFEAKATVLYDYFTEFKI